MTFKSLHIIEPILKSLAEEGYTTPTPIQAQAIPIILEGGDLLGSAQTGTGKTAAFAIPIIQLLSAKKAHEKTKKIRCLIITPTRELAVQIGDSFKAYGRHSSLNGTVIYGGVNQGSQTNALRRGVDILVATPGRLLDLMNQGYVSLKDVEIFVLDEADRMLDMGFLVDVKKILHDIPKKRQSLFFSATLPPEIVKLAHTILHEPTKVEVKPVETTAEAITQYVCYVDKVNKQSLLVHMLEDENIRHALVFTRTKHGADVVVKMLLKNNISAEAIHGNKTQNARQRALNSFKAQKTRVLVATDIAARGIDVDELEYVFNYEVPNVAETYIHRIGRTGRAGTKGTAFSFCDASEKSHLRAIEKLVGRKIPTIEQHPFPLVDNHPPKDSQQRRPHRQNARPSAKPRAAAPSMSGENKWKKPKRNKKRRPA